ncbi:MAG: hypothetical protein AAGC99_24445, partial [Pseudomonadota bacterium]
MLALRIPGFYRFGYAAMAPRGLVRMRMTTYQLARMISNRADRSMVITKSSDNQIILSVVKDRHKVSKRPSVRAVRP